MKHFSHELFKILRRKHSLILLVLTSFILPIQMIVLVKLFTDSNSVVSDAVPLEVAHMVIRFTHLWMFLPLWVLALCSAEFSVGFVNRYVSMRSRSDYLFSKFSFCILVSFFFATLGLISLILSLAYLGLSRPETANAFFYCEFFLASFLSSFGLSVFLLLIVFVVRSGVWSILTYMIYSISEGILIKYFDFVHSIRIKWLPLAQVRYLYARSYETVSGGNNYKRLLLDFDGQIFSALLFVGLTIAFTGLYFLRKDLRPLSD